MTAPRRSSFSKQGWTGISRGCQDLEALRTLRRRSLCHLWGNHTLFPELLPLPSTHPPAQPPTTTPSPNLQSPPGKGSKQKSPGLSLFFFKDVTGLWLPWLPLPASLKSALSSLHGLDSFPYYPSSCHPYTPAPSISEPPPILPLVPRPSLPFLLPRWAWTPWVEGVTSEARGHLQRNPMHRQVSDSYELRVAQACQGCLGMTDLPGGAVPAPQQLPGPSEASVPPVLLASEALSSSTKTQKKDSENWLAWPRASPFSEWRLTFLICKVGE